MPQRLWRTHRPIVLMAAGPVGLLAAQAPGAHPTLAYAAGLISFTALSVGLLWLAIAYLAFRRRRRRYRRIRAAEGAGQRSRALRRWMHRPMPRRLIARSTASRKRQPRRLPESDSVTAAAA